MTIYPTPTSFTQGGMSLVSKKTNRTYLFHCIFPIHSVFITRLVAQKWQFLLFAYVKAKVPHPAYFYSLLIFLWVIAFLSQRSAGKW